MRRVTSAAVVLLVRADPASPWIEVARAPPDSTAELDRQQRLYTASPLLRDVFLELNTPSQEDPDSDLPVPDLLTLHPRQPRLIRHFPRAPSG